MPAHNSAIVALSRLISLLARLRPNVLVGFMFHADLLCRIAGKIAGVPNVVSSVRSINMGGRHREWSLRLTRRLSHAVVTNARATADHLVRRKIAVQRSSHVIPNGIEVERFRPPKNMRRAVRSEFEVDEDTFLWIAVGRLEPPKDYPNVLRAFAGARAAHSNVELWIVGDGPGRASAEGLAEQLGIGDACRFLGLRTDVPRLLAAADALVQGSAWEGLPNAVVEALAAGRPVVATDAGGTRELVDNGRSGFLVPPRDTEALKNAMRKLMTLPAKSRREMGAVGQQHVASYCDLEQVVVAWERLFFRASR